MLRSKRYILAVLLLGGCALAPRQTDAPKPTPIVEKEVPAFPATAEFSIPCKVSDLSFSIRFASKSGDPAKRDFRPSFVEEDREVDFKLAPEGYRAAGVVNGYSSVCEGIPAFKVQGTEQLLFIFSHELESKKAETSLVLFDLKGKKPLQRLEKIGALDIQDAPRFTVIPAQDGFQVKLTEGWKKITIKKGSMTTKWMRFGNSSKH